MRRDRLLDPLLPLGFGLGEEIHLRFVAELARLQTDEADGLEVVACPTVKQFDGRFDRSGKDNPMTAVDPELDVRSEVPRRRHELIFETFAELPPGSAYVLVNDHDPKPLRYQLEAENAGEFSWEYLEDGPEVWRVRIGRTSAAPAAGG